MDISFQKIMRKVINIFRDKKPSSGSPSSSPESESLTSYLADLESQATKRRGAKRRSLKQLFLRLHHKGCKHLTIMLVPHTEKKILSWHVSVYKLLALGLIISTIAFVSVISLVDKSGEDIQFYDIGLGNHQFGLQTIHIAEVAIPLHKLIRKYFITVRELYSKLDLYAKEMESLSPAAIATLDAEIEELSNLVKKCRNLRENCKQGEIEEILRKSIYLSHQDNYSIKKAIKLSEKIFTVLNTKERRHLFEHTPSIWPTQGYLLSPYGLQVDPLRGYEVFKRGIEIGALLGTPVIATAPGRITNVSFDKNYGLKVHIKHSYGMNTFYAQLDRVQVQKGERIEKGEVIGYVGQSGDAVVPMLYYEVHVGTVAYNPYAFLNHLQNLWRLQPKI